MAMKCLSCEFENRPGVRFCEECGAKLEQVCRACGGIIPPDRRFCGYCGQALVATVAPPRLAPEPAPAATRTPSPEPPPAPRPVELSRAAPDAEPLPARPVAPVEPPPAPEPPPARPLPVAEPPATRRPVERPRPQPAPAPLEPAAFSDSEDWEEIVVAPSSKTATPKQTVRESALLLGLPELDEFSLKMQIWALLRKFGESGTTPRKFAEELLSRGQAKGALETCAEQLRAVLDSMLRLPGYHRTEKLAGGRYRAVDLRGDARGRKSRAGS